jgi:hypothetical protein
MAEYWNNESIVTGGSHRENRHLACSVRAQAGCLCSQYWPSKVSKNIIPPFQFEVIDKEKHDEKNSPVINARMHCYEHKPCCQQAEHHFYLSR